MNKQIIENINKACMELGKEMYRIWNKNMIVRKEVPEHEVLFINENKISFEGSSSGDYILKKWLKI